MKITGVSGCPYEDHEVKTDDEIAARAFIEEHSRLVCVSPFKEINCGEESIYDYVQEGYVVPDKVIVYLQTRMPYLMCPVIYEHPFKMNTENRGICLLPDDEGDMGLDDF